MNTARTRRQRFAYVLVVAVTGLGALGPSAKAANIGSGMYNDVINAAYSLSGSCPSPHQNVTISTNRLAALVITPTWTEGTGGQNTFVPSPMLLGRADTGYSSLYWNKNTSKTATTRRVFWHPGVDQWQLDDVGSLGNRIGPSKFDETVSSTVVARDMFTRFCSNNGNTSTIFAPWVSCSYNSQCNTNYNTIYSPSTDSLKNLSTDSTVQSDGGVLFHQCRIGTSPLFDCFIVDPHNAKGYTANWGESYDPSAQTTGATPLASKFYIFDQVVGSTQYEWRAWLKRDTGFSSSMGMRRTYGSNSRAGLAYATPTFCDVTANVCT